MSDPINKCAIVSVNATRHLPAGMDPRQKLTMRRHSQAMVGDKLFWPPLSLLMRSTCPKTNDILPVVIAALTFYQRMALRYNR